jgi:hypothetical protein
MNQRAETGSCMDRYTPARPLKGPLLRRRVGICGVPFVFFLLYGCWLPYNNKPAEGWASRG